MKKKDKNRKRVKLFAQITVDAMTVFGGTPISKLCPAYKGEDVLREIDMAVYLLMLSHSAGGYNPFFASPATLAKVLGREIGTIRRAMKRIALAEFVTKVGYRIAHKKSNSGFTVKTAAEGREMIAKGKGLCFSTRVYSVRTPDEYLLHLKTLIENPSEILGQKRDFDFTRSPADFGITTHKPKGRLVIRKDRLRKPDETGGSPTH